MIKIVLVSRVLSFFFFKLTSMKKGAEAYWDINVTN